MFLRIIYTEKDLEDVEELFSKMNYEFPPSILCKKALHNAGTYDIFANRVEEFFERKDPLLWGLEISEDYKTRVQLRESEGVFQHPNYKKGDVYGMLLEGLGKHRIFEYPILKNRQQETVLTEQGQTDRA